MTIHVDRQKRALLKLLGVGSVGLFVGHLVEKYWGGSRILLEHDFENFKLVETKKKLVLSDKSGEEIVTFEKE